MRKIDNITSEW